MLKRPDPGLVVSRTTGVRGRRKKFRSRLGKTLPVFWREAPASVPELEEPASF